MRRALLGFLYRRLLRLVPEHLRHTHGRAMEGLFLEVADEEIRRLGVVGYVSVLVGAVSDIVAARSRFSRVGGRPPARSHPIRHRTAAPFGDPMLDIKTAVRGLARAPGFTLVAVAILALGIGANTAVFSVLNALLFEPLPYDRPAQLFHVYSTFTPQGVTTGRLSWPDARDYAALTASVDDIAVLDWGTVDAVGDEPEVLDAGTVSGNFFELLGARPAAGRLLQPGDELSGADLAAVLGHRFWRRRYGGDPTVIGRSLELDGRTRTIVGVLDEAFEDPSTGENGPTDVWLPLTAGGGGDVRPMRWLNAIARLSEGVTPDRVDRELAAAAQQLAEQYPGQHPPELGARVVPLRDAIWGEFAMGAAAVLAAVGVVLAIACANIAALFLARGAGRRREVAVRAALGASRLQVVRLFLIEGLMVSVAAGVVGWLTAGVTMRWLSVAANGDLTRVTSASMDVGVLAFTAGVCLLTALGFALLPALATTRFDVVEVVKESGRGSVGVGPRRAGRLLVIGQLALTFVLLVGAGVMVTGLRGLLRVDTGYDVDDVLTFQIQLPASRYPDADAVRRWHAVLVERLESLQGVQYVGIVDKIPLGTRWGCRNIAIDPATESDRVPCAESRAVSPDYFRAMGMGVQRGRGLDETDGIDSRVAVVNQTMARRFWPDGNVLGRTLQWRGEADPRVVIGVVDDVRHRGPGVAASPEVYTPLVQTPDRRTSVVVRTATPQTLLPAARSVVAELDPKLPLRQPQTMRDALTVSLQAPRLGAMLFGGLAVLALLLAAIGNYGVLAHSVAQRRHEVGIRMALGAAAPSVVGMVVGQGMRMVAVALMLGVAGGIAVMRIGAGVMPQVRAFDPVLLIVASVVLIVTTTAASYLPARRATTVDPVEALRV